MDFSHYSQKDQVRAEKIAKVYQSYFTGEGFIEDAVGMCATSRHLDAMLGTKMILVDNTLLAIKINNSRRSK